MLLPLHVNRTIGVLLALAMAGCGGLGHGIQSSRLASPATPAPTVTDGPAEPLLTDEDLNPGADVREMSADALRQYMDGAGPEGLGQGDDLGIEGDGLGTDASLRPLNDGCVARALHRLTIHVQGDAAIIAGHIDLSPCLASDLAAPGAEVVGAKEQLRVFLSISCDGVSMAKYDGKPYGDLVATDDHPCATAAGAHVVMQTDDDQDAQLRHGALVSDQGRQRVHALAGQGGGTCRYTLQGGHLAQAGCADVSREIIVKDRMAQGDAAPVISPDEGKEDYLRVERLPGPDDSRGGIPGATLRVTRNNWTGEVAPASAGQAKWRMQDASGNVAGTP